MTGDVNVSVLAGEISISGLPPHPQIGQQVLMGTSGLILHITPEVAAQWLPVITEIAKESNA